MTGFILIAVLLTLTVLLFLVRSLLKPVDSSSYERHAQNIHYAKDRLQELDQQLQSARITAVDYETLKLEIESMLVHDIDLAKGNQPPSAPSSKTSNGVVIALLCGLIPFAGLVLYQITGTPLALQAQTVAVKSSTDTPSQPDIDSMVRSLEQRLQNNPDDLDGWAMLARTHGALGRYAESIQANMKLLELGGESPDIYAALADTSALLAGGALSGQPSKYLQQALRLNPEHPQSLWLAGLGAAQVGDKALALNHWNKLLPLLADVPQQQTQLRSIIKQTFDPQILDQQTLSDISQQDATPASATTDGLTVYVELSASIAKLSQPNDTVFVIVKALNGPPAPLAVRRLQVSDLPSKVRLSDADAMLAQFKLSLFEDVLVSARVAKSGNPVAQAGDIQSTWISTKSNNDALIELQISEVVR